MPIMYPAGYRLLQSCRVKDIRLNCKILHHKSINEWAIELGGVIKYVLYDPLRVVFLFGWGRIGGTPYARQYPHSFFILISPLCHSHQKIKFYNFTLT